jgi:hypothetical protein
MERLRGRHAVTAADVDASVARLARALAQHGVPLKLKR